MITSLIYFPKKNLKWDYEWNISPNKGLLPPTYGDVGVTGRKWGAHGSALYLEVIISQNL